MRGGRHLRKESGWAGNERRRRREAAPDSGLAEGRRPHGGGQGDSGDEPFPRPAMSAAKAAEDGGPATTRRHDTRVNSRDAVTVLARDFRESDANGCQHNSLLANSPGSPLLLSLSPSLSPLLYCFIA